jgi:hypothetical protein
VGLAAADFPVVVEDGVGEGDDAAGFGERAAEGVGVLLAEGRMSVVMRYVPCNASASGTAHWRGPDATYVRTCFAERTGVTRSGVDAAGLFRVHPPFSWSTASPPWKSEYNQSTV